MAEYLTKEKFEELKVELQELSTKRRSEIAERLEYAKSLGDLSENAEYSEARDEQAKVEERIRHLGEVIKRAEIISTHDTSKVTMGSSVTITEAASKTKSIFKIVGSEEANFVEKKLSNKSPLGVSLMNKVVGDVVSVHTPSGDKDYKISKID